MRTGYKILLTTSLLVTFADSLIGPLYTVFVQKIGGSILDIGYTVTVYSILTGVLIILVGRISDKIDKKSVTVLGFLLFAIGNFGYLIITKPYHLFILQVIFAIGSACLSAPLTSLFAKFISEENAGFQWALDSGGIKIIVGLSVLAGTFIVSNFGFTVLFLTMGTLQLVSAGIQTRLKM
ncbi:MAG: MFS transporter [Candidatus Yonathbacteria bacterium]|nr:MFS transporter [Candidatus Yonathbacteria bacterium]